MRSSAVARRDTASVIAAYALGLLAVGITIILIWGRHYALFFSVGRDADYALWVTEAYAAWADPFDVTAMNPLQGMVTMLVAINPYFNPGAWVLGAGLSDSGRIILSHLVYFLEVTVSTFVLGRALGFSRAFSYAASGWLALLLFPPFNGIFAFQGWLATTPTYGHAIAMSNLILVLVTRIGAAREPAPSLFSSIFGNAIRASGVLMLLLALLIAAPFYNAGMLIGCLVAAALIVLSSASRRQTLWQMSAAVCIVAACFLLGLFDFYLGAQEYAARFTDAPGYWTGKPRDYLCAHGVLCNRFRYWPLGLTGSYWVHLAAILGGFAAFASRPKAYARLGLLFAATWLGLLLHWILISRGLVRLTQLAPVYFYLMLYPLLALFSLYGFAVLLRRCLPHQFTSGVRAELAVVGAVTVVCAALLYAYDVDRTSLGGLAEAGPRPASAILGTLKREAVLQQGAPYRGAVATVLGAPGGSLRQALGFPPEGPLTQSDQAAVLALAARSGSTHDMLDLWTLGIPTLSEYGQGISGPLKQYMRHLLSHPGDILSMNYAVPMRIDIDVLRSLGVRFLVTDVDLGSADAAKLQTVHAARGTRLHLYELRNPNLGNYSPTRLDVFRADKFFAAVHEDPRMLATRAFVMSSEDRPLLPARNASMTFEPGGVHVVANSDGVSTVLLPLQFSYCYEPAGPSRGKARIMRANGLHTLVLFERQLDLRLRWRYSFWRNSECRSRDADELKALALR